MLKWDLPGMNAPAAIPASAEDLNAYYELSGFESGNNRSEAHPFKPKRRKQEDGQLLTMLRGADKGVQLLALRWVQQGATIGAPVWERIRSLLHAGPPDVRHAAVLAVAGAKGVNYSRRLPRSRGRWSMKTARFAMTRCSC